MISERHLRFYAGTCLRKVRYTSEDVALSAARKARKTRGIHLDSYYCRCCMGFHLTRTKQEITALPTPREYNKAV